MHALDWIGEMMHAIAAVIPRLALIRSTHRGVLFTRNRSRDLAPGLHWYWPVWSELVRVCVVRQTIDLPYQVLIAADSREVVVSVTVVYRVADASKAVTSTDNITDTIRDLSHRAVKAVISKATVEELRSGISEGRRIDTRLKLRLRRDLKDYGVAVDVAFLSEVGAPYCVRLMGDGVTVQGYGE